MILDRLTILAAAAAMLAVAPARAQAVQDYQLPPPSPPPAAPAAGPVDPENPVATPRAVPAPEPEAAPSPAPLPTLTVPAPAASATQSPAPAGTPRPASPRGQAPAQTAPTATTPLPAPAPSPDVEPTVSPTVPPPVAQPDLPAPQAAEPAPLPSSEASGWSWWPFALGGLLLLLAGLALVLRRRGHGEDEPQGETEPAPAAPANLGRPNPAPAPSSPPVPLARPEPAPPEPARQPVAPLPEPRFSLPKSALDGLSVRLEPRHFGRTLLNATFGYQLVLDNRGEVPLGPLSIAGDIVSAHGSRPADEQLSLNGADAVPLHRIDSLAPGESVTVKGELRLPMEQILPIRSGSTEMFVPLARFRIEEPEARSQKTRVFVVGQASDRANGALKPFRLDTLWNVPGPLGQREVSA